MKKIFVCGFLWLCLCGITLNVSAQRFIGSAILGINLSQIEGDDVHGFTKIGVNGGAGITLPVYRNPSVILSVSTELLYAQKGSYKHCSEGYFDTTKYHPTMFEDVNRNIPFNPNIKCNISLDYVQIPVLFHVEELRTGFKFGAGVSWSRIVRAKEIYNGFTRTTTIRSGTYNTSDWSALADVEIRLYKNLALGIRWEMSMVPIRKMHYVCGNQTTTQTSENDPYPGWNIIRDETNNFRNHLLSVRLIYNINEKYERNTKVNNKGELIGTKWIKAIPEYN